MLILLCYTVFFNSQNPFMTKGLALRCFSCGSLPQSQDGHTDDQLCQDFNFRTDQIDCTHDEVVLGQFLWKEIILIEAISSMTNFFEFLVEKVVCNCGKYKNGALNNLTFVSDKMLISKKRL